VTDLPRVPVTGPDARAWRKHVTGTFSAGGRFVTYRDAPGWAAGVHDLLDEVEGVLDAGHAEVVMTLTEDAHRRAETAVNRIDDSAGWLTDIAHRVATIHRAAVARARPAPRSLADRLFELETDAHTLDTFHRAAVTYAEALGPEGIARYRERVAAAWAEEDHTGPRWDDFRLRQARIAVAIADRDPDELIAVTRDDLHSPDDYLEIAQLLGDTGRIEDAVDWARRGLETYAGRWHQTPRLRDWLAVVLEGQGRRDEVTVLYWDAFVRHPTLGVYRQLIDRAGDPTRVSAEAITHLGGRVGRPVGTAGHGYPADPLIEILDHEGRHEEAWTLYLEHGCDDDLALRLAKRREADHPLDAITVYTRDVERHIARKNRTGYRAAVRQLSRIRELAEQAGSPETAAAIVDRVRVEHRQKRNLMSLLDAL
jgi:hypothetical protein